MAVRDYLAIYRRAFASYGNHNGSSYAASIAYSAVFSIFPLMLLAIAFVGFFLHSPEQRQRVADALFSALRSGVTRDALHQQVDAIAGGSGPLGVIGLIGATWSGMSVFDQVRLSLNLVWGTTKPAPFAQQKWIDLRMLLSVGLLVLLSFIATGLLTALARFGAGFGGAELGAGLRALLRAGSIVIPAVISFLAFTLLYCLAPRARVRSSDVWLGALTAAVAFEFMQLLFAYYVANFGHYNQTYGALGGVIAFLVFAYLSGVITIMGGEIAKQHIDARAGIQQPSEPKSTLSVRARVREAVRGLFVDA